MRASALTLILLLLSGGPALGAAYHCPTSNAVIEATDPWDRDIACAGALDAVRFFEALGFDASGQISIAIKPKVEIALAGTYQMRVYGQYDPRTHEIEVTSLKSHRRMALENPSFQLGFSRAMHRSIIAHEVAHALAQNHFVDERPGVAVHEYVAYSVQIATMPVDLRTKVLDANRASPFTSIGNVNDLIHAMRPFVFGVKAYKHFVAQPDKRALLQGIFEGRLRPIKREGF